MTEQQKLFFESSSFDPAAWVLASRKRLLLALCVDYMIVSGGWAIIRYVLENTVPTLGALPVWGKWVLFLVLELSVIRWEVPSLGAAILSMRRFAYRTTDAVGRLTRGKPWFVDAWVKRNESRMGMIIAFLFISDGVKSAVRWTMWNPPQPLFGIIPDPELSGIASVMTGALEIWIGWLIYSVHKKGFLLGLAYLGAEALSVVMSRELWDPFYKTMIEQRSAYLGTGNTEEKVRFAQDVMPEAALVIIAVWAALLIVQLFRYRQLPSKPLAVGHASRLCEKREVSG